MMELTTYTELEIAHRLLTSYAQKCRHLHGHRYEVEITVASPSGLNKDGMIVDFKQLKEVVKEVLDDKWDHGACLNKADRISEFMLKDAERDRLHLIDANPTLEWMVGKWVEDLNAAFRKKRVDLVVTKLKASETAKNTVTWTLDEKSHVFAPWDKSRPDDGAKKPMCAETDKDAHRVACRRSIDAASSDDAQEDNPDASLYMVEFRTDKLPYSTTVRTALTGEALVDRCQEVAQEFVDSAMKMASEHTSEEVAVVLLNISKLPG